MITRSTYKKVKSLNREQLDSFLSNLQESSFNKGIESMKEKVTESITTGLNNTKGIGQVRMTEAVYNITKEMNRE